MRLYAARWVVPVASAPIADGVVGVTGDRIAFVGPRRDAPPGAITELGNAVLIPGLVNTHTHLELTAMRGFLEELDFRPWIVRLTRARQAVLTRELLLASARAGIAEGLLAGITTYADTCESGVALQAMLEMGVRGIVYQEVFGPDPSQCAPAMEALRQRMAMLQQLLNQSSTSRVRLGLSPHAPYTVSDTLFVAVTRLALDEGWPLAIHLAESDAESRLVRDGSGVFADALRARGIAVAPRADSPVALLDRLGVLAARPLLIHCVRATAPDIRRIALHDCAVAHCPASNAKLGHGVAPLLEMLALGIRTGLGSDSVASNNRLDLLDEARLAVLLQRSAIRRFDALNAAGALALATEGGARAMGMGDDIGTLAVGKQADLAVFSLGSPRDLPAYDPADALVWSVAGRSASLVVVAGEERVRDGVLLSPPVGGYAGLEAGGQALAAWREGMEV